MQNSPHFHPASTSHQRTNMARGTFVTSLLLTLFSCRTSTAAAQGTSVATIRQDFLIVGSPAVALSRAEQLEFGQIIQSFVSGTTCNVVDQSIVAVNATEYTLTIETLCQFSGDSVTLVDSYYNFLSQHLGLVANDLVAFGVTDASAPELLTVNGVRAGAGTAASQAASPVTPSTDDTLFVVDNTAPVSSPANAVATSATTEQSVRLGIRQGFVLPVGSAAQFPADDLKLLTLHMEGTTSKIVATSLVVTTVCTVTNQTIVSTGNSDFLLMVVSECTWTSSNAANLDQLPLVYVNFINGNLGIWSSELQTFRLATTILSVRPVIPFSVPNNATTTTTPPLATSPAFAPTSSTAAAPVASGNVVAASSVAPTGTVASSASPVPSAAPTVAMASDAPTGAVQSSPTRKSDAPSAVPSAQPAAVAVNTTAAAVAAPPPTAAPVATASLVPSDAASATPVAKASAAPTRAAAVAPAAAPTRVAAVAPAAAAAPAVRVIAGAASTSAASTASMMPRSVALALVAWVLL